MQLPKEGQKIPINFIFFILRPGSLLLPIIPKEPQFMLYFENNHLNRFNKNILSLRRGYHSSVHLHFYYAAVTLPENTNGHIHVLLDFCISAGIIPSHFLKRDYQRVDR
jgi:hypothetical protein